MHHSCSSYSIDHLLLLTFRFCCQSVHQLTHMFCLYRQLIKTLAKMEEFHTDFFPTQWEGSTLILTMVIFYKNYLVTNL